MATETPEYWIKKQAISITINQYLCPKTILDRKIKLIWDFRGPESLSTAKHHAIHLKEFALKEKLTYHKVDVTEFFEYFSIAFIVVDEKDMLTYRDALRPHRAEVAQ